jgi:acyl-coenzyme A synthetase/AMP-(fatty) acid ligase
MRPYQSGYLRFPSGEFSTVTSSLDIESQVLFLENPSTEDLVSVYGIPWPPNMRSVVFGELSQSDIDNLDLYAPTKEKSVILITSGTTGTPKTVVLPLDRILGSLPKTAESSADVIWGHFYDNGRIAAHNVVAHSLASGGILAARESHVSYEELVEFYRKVGVNAVSLTPSLARRMLTNKSFRGLNLKQITLGGEISDQPLLDHLKEEFPASRITHVFASTETGSLFSVSDGRSGFPSDLLGKTLKSKYVLAISDGVLAVTNLLNGERYLTEDLVEEDKSCSRVFFLGRRGSIINVGGRKVSLARIKSSILTHPAVSDCEVFSVEDRFLGSVVGSRICLREDSDKNRSEVGSFLREKLEKWERPVRLVWIDNMNLNSNGKAR